LLKRRVEEQRERAEIEQLLGSERYREWFAYQESASARREVAMLAREFEAAGDPLSINRREGLISAIAKAERDSAADKRFSDDASVLEASSPAEREQRLRAAVDGTIRQNDRLRQSISVLLTPHQMRAFEASLDRRLARARAQLRLQRAAMVVDGQT
jgi:hypothetical protein